MNELLSRNHKPSNAQQEQKSTSELKTNKYCLVWLFWGLNESGMPEKADCAQIRQQCVQVLPVSLSNLGSKQPQKKEKNCKQPYDSFKQTNLHLVLATHVCFTFSGCQYSQIYLICTEFPSQKCAGSHFRYLAQVWNASWLPHFHLPTALMQRFWVWQCVSDFYFTSKNIPGWNVLQRPEFTVSFIPQIFSCIVCNQKNLSTLNRIQTCLKERIQMECKHFKSHPRLKKTFHYRCLRR